MTGHISDFIHSAAFYDSVKSDYLDDFDFYLTQCKSANGKVLELCCGTGRLTIPLFEAGIHTEFRYALLMIAFNIHSREKKTKTGLPIL